MAQLLQTTSALTLMALLSAGAAQAQTYNVPDGGSFSGIVLPNPSDGDTINLQGATATGDVAVTLPTGANGLTINGAAGGSTVTIDSGTPGTNGASLFTNATGNPVILNLTGGPVIFTGADISGNGGVLSTTGTVSIAGAFAADANKAFGVDGGGAIYANGGSVSLAETSGNVRLANNEATTGSGGAVWASGAVTIGHAGGTTTLTGNTANVNGGAIYAGNSDSVPISISITGALTAQGNTANWGGALYAQSGDIVQDGGDVILGGPAPADGNKATAGTGGTGGAIYARGFNGSSTVGGNVSLAATWGNVTIANNSAAGTGGTGGAIWALGTVRLGNAGGTTTLTKNTAANGGAIYASAGVSINGNLIADDNTAGTGGIIYTNGNVSLAAASGDVTLSNNSAGEGGAIWATGSVTLGNAGGTTTLTNNGADQFGGAIYARNSSSNAPAAISVTGNLTANGNVGAAGGVLYAGSGNVVQDFGDVRIGDTTGNQATGGSGGAIFANTGSVSLAATAGNVTLANNIASIAGGAVYADGSVTLGNVGGTTTLTDNSAGLSGGAVYAHGSSNTQAAISVIGNLIADGNTSAYGGALYAFSGNVVQDFGEVRIGGTTANKATAGSGGAIFANGGGVSLAATAGSISLVNNTATFDGGAIAALGNVTIGNAGGTLVLSGNSAGQNGGAVWSLSNVTLWGTDISNNTAAGNGGAIYAAGDYTLNATTSDRIGGNSAGLLGGAIWAGGNVTLNAIGGYIVFYGNKQNTTGTAQANAIYLDNSAATPATLTLNTAGHTIDFADPVLSNAANGPVAVTATGGGAVAFEGTLYTTQADRWSKIYGNTTVNGGTTFIVTGNAIYGALASDVGQAAPTSFTANSGALIVVATGGEVRADSFAVNNGGWLIGDGTVTGASIAINAGGILMPGVGSPGAAMTINGNLALNVGSTYQVRIDPATAALANVNGTATLTGGAVNAVFAPGGYIEKKYTILTTTGGLGGTTFAGLTNTNLPGNFHDSLSYDANNAYLDLMLDFTPGPDYGGGLNRNQQNVADALLGYFDRNGGIPAIYGALSPNGLGQASGEVATGAQQTTFDAMSQFIGLLTDPFMNQSCGERDISGVTCYTRQGSQVLSYAPTPKKQRTNAFAKLDTAPTFEQRWRVWGAGFGGSQTTNGNTIVGSDDTRSAIYGVAVGADYLFSPDTLAGFALAGGGTNFSVNGMGSGRSDLFQAGVYLRHTEGPAYVSAALAYGWQEITTDRAVLGESLRANFNANAFSGRLEGGYRFATGWGLGLTPYAAAQVTSLNLPGYSEQMVGGGANAFGLDYAGKTATDTRSELGLRTDKSFAVENGILTLRGRLAWAHDFNPDRATAATFQALPGASFVVNGAARASDSALVGASAEMVWGNGWSVGATFDGEFSNVTESYAGKGAIRYRW